MTNATNAGRPSDEAKRLRSEIMVKMVSVMNDKYRAGRESATPAGCAVMDGPDEEAERRADELESLLDQLAGLSTGSDRDELDANEPLLHTDITDVLPDAHPLANKHVHCDTCGGSLHASNNECMQPWVEKNRRDLYFNAGNFCLGCYAKAGGHPWPAGSDLG